MSNSDSSQQKQEIAPPDVEAVQSLEDGQNKPDGRLESLVGLAYAQWFIGPLPPPEILIQYNQAHPGLADRIVKMAEIQEEHRIDLEKKTVNGEIDRAREASRLGFVLGLVIEIGAIYLLAIGRSIEGFGTLLPGIAVVIGSYVYGSNKREKERRDKAKLMAQALSPTSQNEETAQ